MDRLNTGSVENTWLLAPTVVLYSLAVSVHWNAQTLFCAESVKNTA